MDKVSVMMDCIGCNKEDAKKILERNKDGPVSCHKCKHVTKMTPIQRTCTPPLRTSSSSFFECNDLNYKIDWIDYDCEFDLDTDNAWSCLKYEVKE